MRAGAALILTGLIAEGTTEVSGVHHIDRGYVHLAEKLTGLGADIYRVTVDESKLDHSASTERVVAEETSGNLFKKIQPSLA